MPIKGSIDTFSYVNTFQEDQLNHERSAALLSRLKHSEGDGQLSTDGLFRSTHGAESLLSAPWFHKWIRLPHPNLTQTAEAMRKLMFLVPGCDVSSAKRLLINTMG